VVLVPDGLAEQVAHRRHRRRVGSGAVDANGSALHTHGTAVFSIHRSVLLPRIDTS